jgi:hypothetical protein
MLVKRIMVIVISLILGAAVSAAIIVFLIGTTIAEYGGLYFFLTAFFMGCAFAIWLDKFLGTEFLPE